MTTNLTTDQNEAEARPNHQTAEVMGTCSEDSVAQTGRSEEEGRVGVETPDSSDDEGGIYLSSDSSSDGDEDGFRRGNEGSVPDVADTVPDVADTSMGSMFAEILTSASRDDVRNKFTSVRDWVRGHKKHGEPFIGHYVSIPADVAPHIDLLEDVAILLHSMLKSVSTLDRYVAVIAFCKLRGSRLGLSSTLIYLCTDLFGDQMAKLHEANTRYDKLGKHVEEQLKGDFEPQADQNVFAKARKWLGMYGKLKNLPIYQKLHKFMVCVLVMGLLGPMGVTFSALGYSKLAEATFRRKHNVGFDMVHSMIDTACFICDRGMELAATGDLGALAHSGSSYEDWLKKSKQVLSDAKFVSCPEGAKLDVGRFRLDLKESIEKGESILKFLGGDVDKFEKSILVKTLSDLLCLEKTLSSKGYAREMRPDPLGVLISGGSGVCKSQFTSIVCSHFARVTGKSPSPEFVYTKSCTDAFWSGFQTYMTTIILDDAGFMNPNLGEVDPTVIELLQVINSIPYCPPQAAVEDKGVVPLRCELVVVTANDKGLNLEVYFNTPYAVARRLKLVVHLEAKAKYCTTTAMVDPELVPKTEEGCYMDIWDISVFSVQPNGETTEEHKKAKYVLIQRFESIYTFLEYYTLAILSHRSNQEKAKDARDVMGRIGACATCFLPSAGCKCEHLHWDTTEGSASVVDPPPRRCVRCGEEDYVLCDCGDASTCIFDYVSEDGKLYFLYREDSEDDSGEWQRLPTTRDERARAKQIFLAMEFTDRPDLTFNVDYPKKAPAPRKGRKFERQSGEMDPYDESDPYVEEYEPEEVDVDFPPGELPELPPCQHSGCVDLPSCVYLEYAVQIDTGVVQPGDFIWPWATCEPQSLEEGLTHLFQYKLWFVSKVIQGEVLAFDIPWWNACGGFALMAYCSVVYAFILTASLLAVMCAIKYFWPLCRLVAQRKYGYLWKLRMTRKVCADDAQCSLVLMRLLGERVQSRFTTPSLKALSIFLGTAAGLATIYGVSRFMQKSHKVEEQGGAPGVAPIPHAVEKEKFYYSDPYVTTPLDISQQSRTAQGSVLEARLKVSTAKFFLRFDEFPDQVATTNALNVVGQWWLVNKHAIKGTSGSFDLMRAPKANVSPNMYNIRLDVGMVRFHPTEDLALVNIRSASCGYDLRKYFPLDKRLDLTMKGSYFIMGNEGLVSERNISNIRPCRVDVLKSDGYLGRVVTLTQRGQCGSPCLVTSDKFQIIAGIHAAGNDRHEVQLIHVSQAIIKSMLPVNEVQVSMGPVRFNEEDMNRTLQPVHSRSPWRWVQRGYGELFGTVPFARTKTSSKVKPTFIAPQMAKRGVVTCLEPPLFNAKPWERCVLNLAQKNFGGIHQTRLREASDAYVADILAELTQEDLDSLVVYDENTAINGKAGVYGVDHLNFNTSAGFPWKCSKRALLEFGADGLVTSVDPRLRKRVDSFLESYARSEMCNPIYDTSLKDEPVSRAKNDAGKVRAFQGADVAHVIIGRRYFASMARLRMNKPFVFESMVGLVAQSPEWNDLLAHLRTFPNMGDGDFQSFDTCILAILVIEAIRVDIMIYAAAGAGIEEQTVRWCLLYDLAFPLILVNGELVRGQCNPSGNFWTVFINCSVNSIIMRYVFAEITSKPPTDFRTFVRLVTYGDDAAWSVSDLCKEFNHCSITGALSGIGFTYTMAEKGAVSIPFLSEDKISFLKRKFRYDEDIGTVVGPLDESSIEKMLTIRKGTDLCDEAHAIQVIGCAVREYFFYGKDVFHNKSKMLKDVVDEAELTLWLDAATFPTYAELLKDFWSRGNASTSKPGLKEVQETQSTLVKAAAGGATLLLLNEIVDEKDQGSTLREKGAGCVAYPETRPCEVKESPYEIQSDVMLVVEGDVERAGEHAGDDEFASADAQHVALATYLARPIKINTTVFDSSSSGAITSLTPWSVWRGLPSVSRKLGNFALMRGTLRLKFEVSATPFMYGELWAIWQPLLNFRNPTIVVDSGTRHRIPFSQLPHMVMRPGEGTSYTLDLPLVYHYNWLDVQKLSDFANLGTLTLRVFEPMRSANGAAAPSALITVYASVENLVLSGSTGTFVPQSDEYGEGCVSAPATWTARLASKLEDLPVIGRFATATRIGATAIGSIARMFGFTNVPVIADTLPVRPESFPKFATSEIGFPVEKLTLDPKNELSVDPRIVGLTAGTDEMSLAHIAGRESWLCSVDWVTALTPNSALFTSRVNPLMHDVDASAQIKLYLTPAAFVANAFAYWRGTMIFRFKVVCSKYHRGKLLIQYETTGVGGSTVIAGAVDTNSVFSVIVDLEEAQEVEIPVPYQQARQFLRIRTDLASARNWNTTDSGVVPDPLYDNGAISVRVLTPLTAPVASSSVGLHVYVRAGDDIEFASPEEIDLTHRLSYFAPQSDFSPIPSPVLAEVMHKGKTSPHQYLVHFGESVKSLRQLLHRYSLSTVESVAPSVAANTISTWQKVMTKYPLSPGYSPDGYSTAMKQATGTSTYNFCTMCPLAYFAPAFLGSRGGVNWSFNANSSKAITTMRAYRYMTGSTVLSNLSVVTKSVVTPSDAASLINSMYSGASGQALVNQLTQAGMNVEFPMFSASKFQFMDRSVGNGGRITDGSFDDNFIVEGRFPYPSPALSDTIILESYCATAPDHGLYFFQNVPTMYLYGVTPVAG